ncbi:hypothetical protein [Bacillus songklensis]
MESKPLDEKWLKLLKELVEPGISKEEFKGFLEAKKASKRD